ncbi:hypothetical protein S7335_2509 [Synechococcus sp. PCC 7335]|nr:hypothetical protein S7335_2509 [Synechococcus sp. PCC 7335]
MYIGVSQTSLRHRSKVSVPTSKTHSDNKKQRQRQFVATCVGFVQITNPLLGNEGARSL